MVEQKQPKTNTNTTHKKKTTSLNPGAAVWKPPSYSTAQKKTSTVTPPSAPATNGGTTIKTAAATPAATATATRTAASIVAGTGSASSKPSGASSSTNKAPPSAWGSNTSTATKPKPQASTTITTTTATSSTPITTTTSNTTTSTAAPTQAPPPVTGWGNKNVMAAIKAAPPTMVPPQPLLQAAPSNKGGGGGKQSSSRGERNNRNGQQQQKQQQRSNHQKQQEPPSRPQQQQQQQPTQQTAAPSTAKTGGGSAWGPSGNKHVVKAAPLSPPSGSSGANGSSTAKQPPSAGSTAAAGVVPQAKASADPASASSVSAPVNTAPSPAPAVVESSWSKVASKNKKAVTSTAASAATTTTSSTSVAPTKGHNKQQQQQQQGKGSSHPNQQQQQQQQHGHHHHQGGNQHHSHNHNHHHHHHHHHHKKEHGKRMEVTDATLFTNEGNNEEQQQQDSNVNVNTKNQNGSGSPKNSSETTVVTRFTADALLNLRQLFLEAPSTSTEEGSTSKDDYKEWIWNSLTRLEDINRQMNQPRCNKPYTYGGGVDSGNDKQPRINKDGILVAPKGELIRKEGSEDPNIFINEHGQEVYVKPLEVNDDKRWKPKTAISKATSGEVVETKEDTDDEDDEAALLKQALSLLNKLTPTTFPKLAPLFVEQIIQSESLLGEGLKLLISKAQQEPHFCPMYAQVCLTISNTPLPFCPNEKKQGRTLKKMLLEECQHEFDLSQEAKVAKALETMVDPNDEEERQYRKQLIKHNYLGHMTFIGEIYKVDLASMKVMLMCLPILLTGDRNIHDKATASSSDGSGEAAVLLEDHPDTSDDIDEETIECFTKLMTTIGHRLEEEVIASEQSGKKKVADHMETLNALWTRVHHLAHGPHCSNRIKFMLLDLMELRDNGWTARRKTETAKTLQDIRMEAALEMSPAQPPRGSLHRGTSSGSIRSLASGAASAAAAAAAVDKDGFTTIVAKTAKLPRSMSQGALRRSQSGGKLSGGAGGGGGNKLPHPPFRRSTSTDVMMAGGISPGNSFTRSPVRMPPKAGGGGRDSKSSKGFSALQDSLPFDTIVETKTIATPKTTTTAVGDESTKEKKSAESTLDLTKCEKKVKAILKEYLSNHDMKDAVLSFEEILLGASSPDDKEVAGAKCMETMIFVVMESSPSQVDQYTLLWKELLSTKPPILSKDMILKGIRDPFEFVQDIMIDAPMARTVLLNLMSHVLSSPVWNESDPSSSSTSSIAFMTELPEEFVNHGKSADFAVKLCLASSKDPSEAELEVIKELMTDDETKTYGSALEFVKEHSK